MEPVQRTHERPGTVTVVVVLAWIAGILNIVAGIFVIIDRHDRNLRVDSAHTPDELLVWGIVAIILGAIYVLLASALGRGSRTARLVFGIVAVLNLAGGAYAAIAYSGEQRGSGVGSMVLSIIVLWLLYGTEKDREFFAT
jgi:drug/metabolite transporter (DMT)-like permease